MAVEKPRRIAFAELKAFCLKAYRRVGVPEDEAELVAEDLARSDARGVETHGVMRLPIYIQRLERDQVRRRCQFEILRRRGATAHVAAHGSMGHLVARRAMELAMELAREHGIGWVAVRESGHFGVAGLYPLMAARQDLIGYICTNTGPLMAPFGGRGKLLGNNPMSYAFPADRHLPVVVDFSCTVVAAGKLMLARNKGEKIPLGWAVDQDGLPTDDPALGYPDGALAPLGGHKGYALALAHEILSALLAGGRWTRDIKGLYHKDPDPIQGTSHSFLVVDPDCFVGRAEFKAALDAYIETVKSSPRAKGVDEILMPGEIEFRTEAKRLAEGIPLPAPTAREVEEMSGRWGIEAKFME